VFLLRPLGFQQGRKNFTKVQKMRRASLPRGNALSFALS